KNQLKAGLSYGGADHSISIFGVHVEYNRQINKKLGINAKLTSISQSGNGISAFGLSDLFINANYIAKEIGTLTFGFKLPMNNGNKLKNKLPLPMDYQSSLGSLDFILGISHDVDKFQLTFAIQQPLGQNQNQFVATDYPATSPLRQFQTTNKFNRRADIMVRVAYPITVNEKFKITPSLLPILHLGKDKFTDAQKVERVIDGSGGLTLNGAVHADYKIDNENSFQFSLGVPFIVRKLRPDGLTRSFITALEYRMNF
ncbi:MAG: hypothetical protein ABIR66_05035, partial [Saprospiraceae bacterium]